MTWCAPVGFLVAVRVALLFDHAYVCFVTMSLFGMSVSGL
jgi:hypothetical protein